MAEPVTDKAVITDAEVEAFHRVFSSNGFDAREALAAFLESRVPEAQKIWSAKHPATEKSIGFNACRDIVLAGKR
jgi:hypothetical protein